MTDVQGPWLGYFGRCAEVGRTDSCRNCRTTLVLYAYNTREWFRLGPLPLLPLTAYRIFDQCGLCGYSRRLPLVSYRTWANEQLAEARAAVAAQPMDPAARLALGWQQHELGLMWDALATAAPALATNQAPAALHHLAGVSWRALRRWREAIRELSAAVDRADHEATFHLDLGRTLLQGRGTRGGETERALHHIQAAAELAPEEVEGWIALAQALAQVRRWSGARAAWTQALQLDPRIKASPIYGPAIERVMKRVD